MSTEVTDDLKHQQSPLCSVSCLAGSPWGRGRSRSPGEVPLARRRAYSTKSTSPPPRRFGSAPLLYEKAGADTQAVSKEGNENYMGCGLRKEEEKKETRQNYLTWKGRGRTVIKRRVFRGRGGWWVTCQGRYCGRTWGDQRDHVSRLGILRKEDYTNHRCY